MIPQWALFGLMAAILSGTMMLLQERLKVDGFALAFWNKIMCVAVTLPLVLMKGLPGDPVFYTALFVSCVVYAISDVIFFRSIPKVGAGIVSRLLPVSVIFSFLFWFLIDPALLHKYASAPVISAMILVVLCLWVWFATHLKKCPVSMQAVRLVWFVILAAVIGTPLTKILSNHAGIGQGPYAYTFVSALVMLALWSIYFVIRRPIPVNVLFSRHSCIGGMIIGSVSALMVVVSLFGYYHVDNPAYLPAVRYLDSVFILGIYALTGRKSEGNLRAGFGLVACAIALIILKGQIH
jgi:hypothetical protein